MQTTRLSSKGQVIIPKIFRNRYNWNSGQKLNVIDTGDGILLKPSRPFKKTELEQVAGILKYSGKPISIDQMNEAIKKGRIGAKKMISVDTNVIIRLLTGDDPIQLEKSKTLFSTDTIFIPTSVVLECEWVLRYAYNFKQPEITAAFQSLFGLSNVQLEKPHEISNAIEWHQNGMDFADAIHLALSEEAEAFLTFDKSLIKAAQKNTTIPVREP